MSRSLSRWNQQGSTKEAQRDTKPEEKGQEEEEKKLFEWGLYTYLENRCGGDRGISIIKEMLKELQSRLKALLDASFGMTNDSPMSYARDLFPF